MTNLFGTSSPYNQWSYPKVSCSHQQTHKPKMKVAPLGGAMVLKAKVAIELVDGLAESPT